MGPAGSNDTSLPGSNSTISIPTLTDNGSNWIDYKTKALIAMGSWGLMGHVEGRAQKPKQYAMVDDQAVLADGKTAVTEDQVESREKRIDDFETKEYLARHIIINSVSLRLAQNISKLTSAKAMWDAIVKDSAGKMLLYQVDARRRLQEMKCSEGEDIKTHLTEMNRLRQELAGMGSAVNDDDFTAMIIGSLPSSFWPLLSALIASSKVSKTTLEPDDLIQYTLEEYKHCLVQERASKGDTAMTSKAGGKMKGKSKKSKSKSNVKCGNCGREGHTDKECWREGGGAEGQGPNQKKKTSKDSSKDSLKDSLKELESKPTANAVMVPTDDLYTFFCTSTFDDLAASLPLVPTNRRGAIIDSGASRHFCSDRSKFDDFEPLNRAVTAADGCTFQALGMGNVKIELPNGQNRTTILLQDTLYAPDVQFTLISMSRIIKADYAVHFEGPWCEITTLGPKRKV
jgi:hypothetical protein